MAKIERNDLNQYIDCDAQAQRIIVVSDDGDNVDGPISMEALVLFPLEDDSVPVLLLDADPLRTRVVLQTDASFLCIAETAAKCNIGQAYLATFGYSGLVPVELFTTGQIWVASFAVTPSGAQNAVRCVVERRA